jgi:DNA-binding SARP family transcriptional activator
MEFRVLGPLEVQRDGRALDLRGSKRRAVLALLVLQANEVVRTDRLIDELWGDHQPANATAALHNHVSRLRKDLGAEVLVTKPWGYVLRADPDSIDLRRFERLVAEARPLPARERNAKLGEALALWRGPALADLAQEPALEAERARVDELRQSVIEQRIDARLELGQDAEVVPELEELVAEHPLRERLRGQLILALYRSGRQAEALETYRETRRVLVEELGIEPSPELRELEQAILRQDPLLAAVRVPPEREPPEPRPPQSRWRWPRSPLIAGAAALLVALAGLAVAILATPRSGTPHASAARDRASDVAATTTASTATEPTVSTTKKPRHKARVQVGRAATSPVRPRRPPPRRSGSSSGRRPGEAPATSAPAAQTTTAEPRPKGSPKSKPPPPPPPPPPAPPPPPPVLFTDNFDDGVRDATLWHETTTGTGIELAERNGRLEIVFAADGVPGGEYNVLGAHYGTQCRFPGDFDVRVDYQLLDWPVMNGVIVALNAWFTNGPQLAVVRQSQAWGEEYATFWGGRTSNQRTGDVGGSLRIKHVGARFTTYEKSGGRWLALDSVLSDRAPMISIQAMSTPDFFGHRAVRVAFDNFKLRAVLPAC